MCFLIGDFSMFFCYFTALLRDIYHSLKSFWLVSASLLKLSSNILENCWIYEDKDAFFMEFSYKIALLSEYNKIIHINVRKKLLYSESNYYKSFAVSTGKVLLIDTQRPGINVKQLSLLFDNLYELVFISLYFFMKRKISSKFTFTSL